MRALAARTPQRVTTTIRIGGFIGGFRFSQAFALLAALALITPYPLLSQPPPVRRERRGMKKRKPQEKMAFSLFSRSGGVRWEKRAGVMRAPTTRACRWTRRR
jgi:hypothetical protein